MSTEGSLDVLPPATRDKYARLIEGLSALESVVVAFSGGVDSAFLGWAAGQALGERALLATADSASYPREELRAARELARQIGLRHVVVTTDEVANSEYAANPANRCFFCKEALFERLAPLAAEGGFRHVVFGATVDDLGDHRPGMLSARRHGVRAPLLEAGLGKPEIRALSRAAGLPTWDKPAMPCLASRVPYGSPITPEKLLQVERAEVLMREQGFRIFRVRHHGEVARLEVAADEVARLFEGDRARAIAAGLRALGFRYVTLDLEGFRSGRLNDALLQIEPREGPAPAGS